jgi:hypothetical protein
VGDVISHISPPDTFFTIKVEKNSVP